MWLLQFCSNDDTPSVHLLSVWGGPGYQPCGTYSQWTCQYDARTTCSSSMETLLPTRSLLCFLQCVCVCGGGIGTGGGQELISLFHPSKSKCEKIRFYNVWNCCFAQFVLENKSPFCPFITDVFRVLISPNRPSLDFYSGLMWSDKTQNWGNNQTQGHPSQQQRSTMETKQSNHDKPRRRASWIVAEGRCPERGHWTDNGRSVTGAWPPAVLQPFTVW